MNAVVNMSDYAYLRLRARRRRELLGPTGDPRRSGVSPAKAFNEGYAKGMQDAIAGINRSKNV